MSEVCLENRVLAYIRRHELVSPGATIVVGISGGADSMCLLHVLHTLAKELGVKLHAAHLNHRLRGHESEMDAQYVEGIARSMDIPVTVESADVAGHRNAEAVSLEEAARELRYRFLAEVASGIGAAYVAVGHTWDDHIETVVLHLLRGTGTMGLRGLESSVEMGGWWRSSGTGPRLIRPLLGTSRAETAGYCSQHGLQPRVDSSNVSASFLRNRVRMDLLPALRQYNPAVDAALGRLSRLAREDDLFIRQQAEDWWTALAEDSSGGVDMRAQQLAALPGALQSRLIRMGIERVLGSTRDVEAGHIAAVRQLLLKDSGKEVSLPHGLLCRRDYDVLRIVTQRSKASCPIWPDEGLPLRVPGESRLPGWRARSEIRAPVHRDTAARFVAELDLDRTGTDLSVRKRRAGDRFQPLGMAELKKLQDFMVDAKIPRWQRDCVPLVCTPEHIVWVVGWRIDQRARVTGATRRVLRLEFVRD